MEVTSVLAKRGALLLLKQERTYRIPGIALAPEHAAFIHPRPFGRGYLFRAGLYAYARIAHYARVSWGKNRKKLLIDR
jgi:hypothetical protein